MPTRPDRPSEFGRSAVLSALAGFICGGLLIALGERSLQSWIFEQKITRVFGEAIRPSLLTARLAGVESATEAKRLRAFWVSAYGSFSTGFGLPATNAEILAELYPGFPTSLFSSSSGDWLLEKYFEKDFTQLNYLPELNRAGSANVVVTTPSTGCLDVYPGSGAYGVIFGTSETSLSLVAADLQRQLADARVAPMPFLRCDRNAQFPADVLGIAQALAAVQRRAAIPRFRISLVGYSFWWPAVSAQNPSKDAEFLKVERVSHALSWGAPISWDEILPLKLAALPASASPPSEAVLSTVGTFETSTSPTVADLKAMAERAGQAALAGQTGNQAQRGDCDPREAREKLSALIRSLLEISEQVFFYVPPTTPLFAKSWPPCMRLLSTRLLREQVDGRVHVLDQSWTDYGLTWADFVFHPDPGQPRTWRINANHANYGGAAKVTLSLARWIAGEVRR